MRQSNIDTKWQNLTIKQLELAEASIRQKYLDLAHGWNGLRKFKIAAKTMECEDVCTFHLAPHDLQTLPQYKPGQHLTLSIQPHNQKKIVRCYSLSDCFGSENQYSITVKLQKGHDEHPDGKGSSLLHQDTHVGDLIDIKAPKGSFFLNQKSLLPVVLLANGVGITPLLAMMKHLYENDPDRNVSLFYGIQNSKHFIKEKLLRQLQETYPAFSLTLFFSRPLENDRLDQDYQHIGHMKTETIIKSISGASSFLDLESHQKFEFYICGTAPMMKHIIAGLKAWDVPNELINYEAFGAAGIQKKKTKTTPDSKDQQTHTIELRQSGKKLQWNNVESNLLDLCLNQSVPIDCGCCCGECGTCEVAIISGSVYYPDRKPETEVQEGHCLMCIAAPTSSLILDT